jgi:hypothetical protein
MAQTLEVTIEVTAEDLHNFDKGSSTDCPIARALKRALPKAHGVSVGVFAARADHKVCKLPPEVTQWLMDLYFDKRVEPFNAVLTFRYYLWGD